MSITTTATISKGPKFDKTALIAYLERLADEAEEFAKQLEEEAEVKISEAVQARQDMVKRITGEGLMASYNRLAEEKQAEIIRNTPRRKRGTIYYSHDYLTNAPVSYKHGSFQPDLAVDNFRYWLENTLGIAWADLVIRVRKAAWTFIDSRVNDTRVPVSERIRLYIEAVKLMPSSMVDNDDDRIPLTTIQGLRYQTYEKTVNILDRVLAGD